MHAPGFPALSTVALAARGCRFKAKGIARRAAVATTAAVPTSAPAACSPAASRQCRRLHTSPRPQRASDPNRPPNPWKPGNESVFEDNVDSGDGQFGSEAIGGRARGISAGARRRSQRRRSDVSELPAVNLPAPWFEANVHYWEENSEPTMPLPLAMDMVHPKVSRIYSKPNDDKSIASPQHLAALEEYFLNLSESLHATLRKLFNHIEDLPPSAPTLGQFAYFENYLNILEQQVDASWHLADAIYPARNPEYIYQSRPLWWWHIYKDYDPHSHKFKDRYITREVPIEMAATFNRLAKLPMAHTIADFPLEAFDTVYKTMGRDLEQAAPSNFDPTIGKRPIQTLSLHGYAGKSVAQSIMTHAASFNGSDIVSLDAHDIAQMVGNYLGQDCVYARGSVSMLGFRAAELNGKIPRPPDSPNKAQQDDQDDESNIISLRNPFMENAQKVKDDISGIFSNWENLKVNKAVNSIIKDAVRNRDSTQRLVIHIHDYVELSMTMEGSFILSRLRAAVDQFWKIGKPVVLVGTSSCILPSEEYQSMLRELSLQDVIMTRSIRPARAEKETGLIVEPQTAPFNLQAMDFLWENAQNLNRMIWALDPSVKPGDGPQWRVDDMNDLYWNNVMFHQGRNMFNASVLSQPEVLRMAKAFKSEEEKCTGNGTKALLDLMILGPLQQQPGVFGLGGGMPDGASDKREPPPGTDEGKYDNQSGGPDLSRLNEYEKRVSNGIIDQSRLRTTFNDVHVAPEITGALKLLTSLALVRPDAFSYGVLAHDKINGCLLYGPPGTGKTMLAKAVAKESGANMLEISGASINDKWVGEAEKLIRAVFTLAKKLSPCVVFLDEADSLLANRSMFTRASHREHINQFLKEWDGMEETNAFIMVATNRPFDLDDAVLRRLPRKLLVDLPLRDDRAAILRLLLRDEKIASDVSLEDLADRTPYYSGSDLKNMCVAAAMVAVEEENAAANAHEGEEPYRYPERRTLLKDHFERALKQIPASISDEMESLRLIRRFDEEYGNRRKGSGKKTMGFGGGGIEPKVDTTPTRVRQGGAP